VGDRGQRCWAKYHTVLLPYFWCDFGPPCPFSNIPSPFRSRVDYDDFQMSFPERENGVNAKTFEMSSRLKMCHGWELIRQSNPVGPCKYHSFDTYE
jgi:hypothetical protein